MARRRCRPQLSSVMRVNARLPTLPKDWMKRLARGSRPSPGKSRASAGARKIGNPRDLSVRVRMRRTLPCVICGRGKIRHHEGDDRGRHGKRKQGGDGLGGAGPGERAHATRDDRSCDAGHDGNRHEALGLASKPGRGIGGKAGLGREQQKKWHGEERLPTRPSASGSRSGGPDMSVSYRRRTYAGTAPAAAP